MAEYIEKEETIQRYQNVVDIVGIAKSADGETNFGLVKDLDVIEFLQALPAADVRENVVGEWIQHYETTSDNETLPYGWECSLCGRWEMEKQPFCNCGAQMVGGAEDGE